MRKVILTRTVGVAAAVAALALTTAATASAAPSRGATVTPNNCPTAAVTGHVVPFCGSRPYPYDGQDPVASGCSKSSTTIDSRGLFDGEVELRYSTACRTVWARVTIGTGSVDHSYALWAEIVRPNDGSELVCNYGGPGTFSNSTNGGETGCYTPMLDDAFMTSYATGGANGDIVQTGAY